MKIGFFQFAPRRLKGENNLRKVEEWIVTADFDLLVLPELFACGYLFRDRQELIDFTDTYPFPGVVSRLCRFLQRKNKKGYLVGTTPERIDGRVFNTAFVLHAGGLAGIQRKRHLPRLEKPLFAAGKSINIINTGKATIGIVTCFDAWFPEMFRILKQQGVQILCQPANFGGPQTLDIMRVRAMENHLFALIANRSGREQVNDVDATFRGDSQILDPNGAILTRASAATELKLIDLDPTLADTPGNHLCDDLPAEWRRYSVRSRK